MSCLGLKDKNAVRWDTLDKKIYFDLEKGAFVGRLILEKSADGKIGMRIAKSEVNKA
jgi:hypothetical protein